MLWSEAARSIRGAWRLTLLDVSGMYGFNLTVEGFWRSFLVYVGLTPIYLLLEMTAPRQGDAAEWLPLALSAAYLVRITVSTVLLAALCRLIGAGERFVPLIVASNWWAVFQLALEVPLVLLRLRGLGGGTAEELLSNAVLLVLMFYGWFITRTALGIGPFAAGGLVVASFVADRILIVLLIQLLGLK